MMSESTGMIDVEQDSNTPSQALRSSEEQNQVGSTEQKQHQSENSEEGHAAPTNKAKQDDESRNDRRQSHETEAVVSSGGRETSRPSGKSASVALELEGRGRADDKKIARRKRRCPIVKIEEFLNNDEGGGERKVDGGADKRSLARAVMQEDLTGFLGLVREDAANIWDSDGHGWTALHWACSRGSTILAYAILQEMRLLKKAGADCDLEMSDDAPNLCGWLNSPEKLNGWSPLHLAVIGGHLEVVHLLMDADCDPSAKDKVGDRPIDCLKRTKDKDGLQQKLRNALLDLSDTEESSCDSSAMSPLRGGGKWRKVAPLQPSRRKGPSRERNRHR